MTYLINTHRIAAPTMTIAIEPQGEICSKEAADTLRARFRMVLAATQPERIVVDLSAVPSISAAGLEALRYGNDQAAANDARVGIADPAPRVRDQLNRHGLGDLLDASTRFTSRGAVTGSGRIP